MVESVKYHVLLVGIDAYNIKPLHGCVNDINAVQRVLVERAGIPVERIRRLASPHPGPNGETTPPEQAATLDNIRAALKALASDEVSKNDRVFVYYSGHGARLSLRSEAAGMLYNSEALVPVDFDKAPLQDRLLFDFELDRLLAAITERTKAVCVVLDCCHSAGATRELPKAGRTSRVLTARDLGATGPVPAPAGAARPATSAGGIGGNVDDCQVVAACLNHELAQEELTPDGVQHGLLTSAFVAQLSRFEKGEILSVPWARVWQKMRDQVETANPEQHLWISGSFARAVLAGPVVESDPGFEITRTPNANEYTIDAGTLADVDVGSKLAVYGDQTKRFPEIGSPEDLAARISPSLIVVEDAKRASATGRSAGAPFNVPDGARARVVAASPSTRLRYAVVPEDTTITAVTDLPTLALTSEADSQVRLVQRGGGWDMEDDIAGANGVPPLIRLTGPKQTKRAGSILMLYRAYSLPLRMATRCTDLPGKLKTTLLLCPEDGLEEDEAASAALPDAPGHPALTYAMKLGDRFCVQIRNASIYDLRVTLLNCAASGKVELLGNQVITARSSQRFWQDAIVGKPFIASTAPGSTRCVDRMVAIGTTLLGKNLEYLRSDLRFSDLLDGLREVSNKEATAIATGAAFVEKWTATQLTLGIGL